MAVDDNVGARLDGRRESAKARGSQAMRSATDMGKF